MLPPNMMFFMAPYSRVLGAKSIASMTKEIVFWWVIITHRIIMHRDVLPLVLARFYIIINGLKGG